VITQASFYTYRTTRLTSPELLAQVRELTVKGDHDQAAIRDIELYLTRGHEHFNARRYHAALKDYLEARLKIYALLDADAPNGGGPFVPVNPGIFDGLLTEMVERVRRFHPAPRPPLPGPVVNPPVNLPLSAFSNLGITQVRPQGTQDPGARINAAVALARAGDVQRAETQLMALLDGGGLENPRLRAATLENLGTVLAHQGAPDRATTRFDEAARLYESIDAPADAARVEESRAAMLASSGNVDGAISALESARTKYESAGTGRGAAATAAGAARAGTPIASSAHLSAALQVQARANQLQHIRDRGSFVSRVMGRVRRAVEAPAPPAMEMHYREVTVSGAALESAVEFAVPVTSERRLRFLAAENPGGEQALRVLEYPLAQANLSQQIRNDYYTVREGALTLEALGVGFDIAVTPGRFEVDLPHHYHFTIQVALAKTYTAIGRFADALAALRTARTYPHLNAAIEAPFLWVEHVCTSRGATSSTASTIGTARRKSIGRSWSSAKRRKSMPPRSCISRRPSPACATRSSR
jgi:tetratricopeptide (TPR) repeat protein